MEKAKDDVFASPIKKAPIVSGEEIDQGVESTECLVLLGEEDEQFLMSNVY